jgi:hypothetical protein
MLTGSAFAGEASDGEATDGDAPSAGADADDDGVSLDVAGLLEVPLLLPPHPAITRTSTRVLNSMLFFIFMFLFIPSHLIAISLHFYCKAPKGSISRSDLL